MKELTADPALVARCGLYCGACRSYLGGRCPGCAGNDKATWCKVRTCCMERDLASCAGCREFSDPNDCRRFNNIISKTIGLVLNSDRRACIMEIRGKGLAEYAAMMADRGTQTLPRRKRS